MGVRFDLTPGNQGLGCVLYLGATCTRVNTVNMEVVVLGRHIDTTTGKRNVGFVASVVRGRFIPEPPNTFMLSDSEPLSYFSGLFELGRHVLEEVDVGLFRLGSAPCRRSPREPGCWCPRAVPTGTRRGAKRGVLGAPRIPRLQLRLVRKM